MSNKSHINITLDAVVLNWIDSLRGQDPRSTFINKVLSHLRIKSDEVFNWGEESNKANEDIKKGNIHSFSNAALAIKWLNS